MIRERRYFAFAGTLVAGTLLSAPAFADQAGLALVTEALDAASNSNAYSVDVGQIGDTNIYFGHYCDASHFGRVVLLRTVAGQPPQVWEGGEQCVNAVSWRDIDGDGSPEIRITEVSGGSGYLAASAVFLRWSGEATQPSEIIRFVTSSYSTWGGMYSRYGFEPAELHAITHYENNFLPVGAVCPDEANCELVERQTFCINECESPVPDNLAHDPNWPAFLAALAADGIMPGNAGPAQEAAPVPVAQQAAFDAWLSE